jgi:hypothetical protein
MGRKRLREDRLHLARRVQEAARDTGHLLRARHGGILW